MKSFASKIIFSFCFIIILFTLGLAQKPQCECLEQCDTCYYCRKDNNGNCIAGCYKCPTQNKSKEWTAVLLSGILDKRIKKADIDEEPRKYLPVINALLKYNNKTIKFNFEEEIINIGLGLNNEAIDKLKETRDEIQVNQKNVPELNVIVSSSETSESSNSDKSFPSLPAFPSSIVASTLEDYRRQLEDFRKKAEELNRKGELADDAYKERIKKYREGIKKYNKAVKLL